MSWSAIYDSILPCVVAIDTPQGSGTGFFFAHNETRTVVAFATAAHVVDHAHDWKTPIKIRHHVTGKELFVTDEDRVIFLDRRRDSASIVVSAPFATDRGGFELPSEPPPMMAPNKHKKIGVEVAWVGYPSIAAPYLCFFTGKVSTFIAKEDSYLIDGVAIHGVSGGPVLAELKDGTAQVVGTVSAYMPNRIRGDALPGLLRAQDITAFQETIRTIQSLDEAQRKEEEAAKAATPQEQNPEPSGPVPPNTQ